MKHSNMDNIEYENETFFRIEIPILEDMVQGPYLTQHRKYGQFFPKQ